MKNTTGKFFGFAAVVFMLIAFLSLAMDINAQTKKKKKTRKTNSTLQIPQPVPQSTLPVIVSTAEQYSDQNQQIVTGNVENSVPTPVEETQPQPETFEEKLERLNTRVVSLEGKKQKAYEEKQRRLLTNLDILTRAETRAESLRKQLFDLVEKENTLKTRLDTLEYDLRPEMIERQVAFAGSLRPEEVRESRRKNLEAEKRNLTNLLTEIQNTRTNLETNVQKADQLVEKIRAVLEKDIDDALTAQPEPQIVKKDQ